MAVENIPMDLKNVLVVTNLVWSVRIFKEAVQVVLRVINLTVLFVHLAHSSPILWA